MVEDSRIPICEINEGARDNDRHCDWHRWEADWFRPQLLAQEFIHDPQDQFHPVGDGEFPIQAFTMRVDGVR